MQKKWFLLPCFLLMLLVCSVAFTFLNSDGHGSESSDMPLEMVISRRRSIKRDRYDLNVTVPRELLSKVLWAACGHSGDDRTVPTLSGYPVVIYVCNETAVYKFVPQNQSLTLWREGDFRELGDGYEAPIQLFIAFDTNICEDAYWGNAESGCTIQSIYLMANALNLGTVCQGGAWLNRTLIHQELGLPGNEEVRYKMPLGYPIPAYGYDKLVPAPRPSSSELPEIQDSNYTIEDALNSVFSSHEWDANPVTKQELSQVLWASYGYSYYLDLSMDPPERHRTVPSAHAYYPMKIYAANLSGVYQYIPEQHTLSVTKMGDSRMSISLASGNPWASSAPLMIAVVWDEDHIYDIETTYVEVGLIAQNVYLEGAAWGLVVDWGKAGTDEEAMREALGLSGETHLHPASIMTVGHPDTPPIISILSPENKTYTVDDVPLVFTVDEVTSWIGYSLDEQMNVTIGGNTTMISLFDGIHTVTVYANDTTGNMGYSWPVYFTIDTGPVDTTPPTISIASPENKTYDATDIPLTFTVDEPVSWIRYSLDGQANVTITGNTTLSGISDGVHSLVVYARDTTGNTGASEIVYFSNRTQQGEPFPTWIVATIVLTAGAGTALAVYLAKVRKTAEKTK